MTLFFYRMWAAALLDRGAYEGIEHDPRATMQSATVVVLASLAAGFGAGGVFGTDVLMLLGIAALALVTWLAWAMLTFHFGTRALRGPKTEVTQAQLMRTIGFAASPGLLQVFAAVPPLTVPVFAVTIVWMIAAMVVAVKQALDFDSIGRAVGVCALAAGLSAAMAVVIGLLFGPSAS